MSRIFFIRHGQASFGADDYDCLSTLGEEQARVLGEHLSNLGVTPSNIISGEMKRHIQTQHHVISQMTDVTLENTSSHTLSQLNEFDPQSVLGAYDPRLAEPIGMRNLLAGHPSPDKEFIRIFSSAMAKWIHDEKGEIYPEAYHIFEARALDGLHKIVELTPRGEDTLVFTSGGVISIMILNLLGIPKNKMLQINKDLVNCGVTQATIRRDGPVLITMNEHPAFMHQENSHLITLK